MAKRPKLYTRLPGSGTGGFQRFRLWQGPDHLLLVGATAIGERYKRFYFADIQAIVFRKTAGWMIGIILLSLLVAGFGLGAFALADDVGSWVLGSIAALFGVVLLIHLALGPTCACHIRTAVQSEVFPSLKRLRTARKVLARIRPFIESAQAARVTAHAESPPAER